MESSENFKDITGKLAFGKHGGYFYSEYSEGRILVPKGDIVTVLKNPYEHGDYSLGRQINNYQHALLKLKLGKEKLSESDLKNICEITGLGVEQEGSAKKCNIRLWQFDIQLDLEITNLNNNQKFNTCLYYIAHDVKAGYFGMGREFGIRYDITWKNNLERERM